MKPLSAVFSKSKRKGDEIQRRNIGASASTNSPHPSYVDTPFYPQQPVVYQHMYQNFLPPPPRYVDTAYPSPYPPQSEVAGYSDRDTQAQQPPEYVDKPFPVDDTQMEQRAYPLADVRSHQSQPPSYVDKPFPVYGTQIERARWYAERRAQQYRQDHQPLHRQESPHGGHNQVVSTPVHYCANPRLIESCTSAASSRSQDVISASNLVVPQDPATNAELSTIKLLRVITDENVIDSSTISVCLETFSWKSCPNYIALSYVWGTDIPEHTILVNGKQHLVQRNLYSALRHIVQRKPPGFLWADAICINQADEEEKSHVVQHMGAIFGRAQDVYACLTPDEGGSDQDFERHKHLVNTLKRVGWLFWNNSGSAADKLSEAKLEPAEILRLSISYLVPLFDVSESRGDVDTEAFPITDYTLFSNNPYWQRIWVLQEVYLAQRLLFFYGPFAIQSRILSGALILLEQFQKYIVSGGDGLSASLRTHPRLRRFALESPSYPEMHRLIVYTSIYPTEIVSLRVAMANFCIKELPRGSRAKDPRDMVFGLLGFATKYEKEYIKADYNEAPRIVYRNVTRALLTHGFADVVSWSQPLEKKIGDLPTWVPDFSSTIYEPLCSQGQAKPWLPSFDASGGRPVATCESTPSSSHTNPDGLSLLGLVVDEISILGNLWYPRSGVQYPNGPEPPRILHGDTMASRSASYAAILALLEEIRSFCMNASRVLDEDVVCRVACADQLVVNSKLTRCQPADLRKHYQPTLDACRELCSNGEAEAVAEEISADARPYIETMLRWVKKRAFRTREGYVGLGPGEAKPGDVVVILNGFSAPYVLRKKEGLARGYEVLGECYVCGIMDGELLAGVDTVEDLFNLE